MEAFPKFLEYRRAALAKAINDLIDTDDRPRHHVDVDELISRGEDEGVEFKSSARWDYRELRPNKLLESVIVKAIAGFLNGKGGHLVIGVGDHGEILGIEPDYKTLSKRPDRDGYQQFLITLISSSMGKDVCSSLSINFLPMKDKEICVVRINPSPLPVYVPDGQQTKFYLRTGNTTQELATRESVNYIKARWQE